MKNILRQLVQKLTPKLEEKRRHRVFSKMIKNMASFSREYDDNSFINRYRNEITRHSNREKFVYMVCVLIETNDMHRATLSDMHDSLIYLFNMTHAEAVSTIIHARNTGLFRTVSHSDKSDS